MFIGHVPMTNIMQHLFSLQMQAAGIPWARVGGSGRNATDQGVGASLKEPKSVCRPLSSKAENKKRKNDVTEERAGARNGCGLRS